MTLIPTVKVETATFSSRYINGTPMYPTPFRLTWTRLGTCWVLIGMEPA